jgi:hypothetical protein
LRGEDIRHIHPVHFEHINPIGHYRFDAALAVRSLKP